MASPQICFAEFAQEEADLFQIREALRAFATNGEISPPAGGNFCEAEHRTTAPAVVRRLAALRERAPRP